MVSRCASNARKPRPGPVCAWTHKGVGLDPLLSRGGGNPVFRGAQWTVKPENEGANRCDYYGPGYAGAGWD
ncbi:hypothetical protein GCM10027360_95080 [Amycolatopsis echigonensis]